MHRENKVKRERENQQDATNPMFIIKLLSQHVSGIIMPIIRRIRPCPTACGVLPGCVDCGWLWSCGAALWAVCTVWKLLFDFTCIVIHKCKKNQQNAHFFFHQCFNSTILSSWWWTLSCSKHVEDNIVELNHWWKKLAFSWFFLRLFSWSRNYLKSFVSDGRQKVVAVVSTDTDKCRSKLRNPPFRFLPTRS